MVDVKHKMCENETCNLQASFHIKGGKLQFCNKHKSIGMINIISKKCEYNKCNIRPSFGIKEDGKPRFCVTHKNPDMIDLITKKCEYENCSIKPSFGIKSGKPQFCSKHKMANMIDITHKHCAHNTCETSASYGKPGHPISHCVKHREKGMIRKSNAKCSSTGCKELAIWGTNWIPSHCETHKSEDHENLVEQLCSSCNLMYILDKTNKCENCNPESWATARLAKQNALMAYLDSRNLKGSSTDIVIDGGICGKERPDRVYDFGDKIVILECDEHQHKERAYHCEQTRMVNIGQSFGGIPVYFIRWNPDNYCPITHTKTPENLKKRYKLCGDLINDIQRGKTLLPKALVSVIYLYYDEWSSLADESWKVLNEIYGLKQ